MPRHSAPLIAEDDDLESAEDFSGGRAAAEILPHSTMQTKARRSERSSNAVIHFVSRCYAKPTMSPCQSLALSVFLPVAISARKWPRKTLSRFPGFPIRSFGQRNSSNSLGASPNSAPLVKRFTCRRRCGSPIAATDVATALAEIALGAPVNGTIEIAGPERAGLDEMVRSFLAATKDPHEVITDVDARYYGLVVNDQSLTPGADPRIGATFFEDRLNGYLTQKNVSEAGL